MANKVRTLLIVAICLAVILCAVLIPLRVTGIIGSSPRVRESVPVEQTDLPPANFFKTIPDSELKTGQRAVFTIEYKGETKTVTVFLLSDYAPKTVDNFIKNADAGLYNGTVFYLSSYIENDNVVETAYLQGGAYTVNEKGELVKKVPDAYYGKIEGEFYANDPNTNNKISFVSGTIGMVHEENDYNSADTEFFFVASPSTNLNGKYAAFGTVIGSEDLENLLTWIRALHETDGEYPIVIKTVRVYTR